MAGKDLQTSCIRYEKVTVLMFHWEHDDMRVPPLETKMAIKFGQLFDNTVERYVVEPVRYRELVGAGFVC